MNISYQSLSKYGWYLGHYTELYDGVVYHAFHLGPLVIKWKN